MLKIPLLAQYEEALYEQNQQLLFQQNQYQTFQHDADYLARAKDISQIDTGITTATSNLKKGGPSFLIDTIQFEGELPISRHKLMPILSRYEGQKLSLMEIEQLIEAITNTFIEQGYLTSRVFIKQQNLTKGVLVLQSVVGNVSRIQGITKRQQTSVFSGIEDHVLNIHQLEAGLDLANRLSSAQLSIELLPDPDVFGSSVIAVNRQLAGVSWVSSLAFNNYSSATYFPQNFSISKEDLLGLFDQFSLNGSQSLDSDNQSHRLTGSYDIPLYRSMFSISQTLYESTTMIDGISRHYYLFSNSSDIAGNWSKTVYRSKPYSLDVGAGFNRKSLDTYVEDVLLDASSYILSTIQFNLKQTFRLQRFGTWMLDYSRTQGIDAWDATVDESSLTSEDPKAQFVKHGVSLFGSRQLWIKDIPITAKTTWTFQYTEDSLYPSHKIGVGGFYSVRGFSRSLQGDKGAYAQHDLTVPILSLLPSRLRVDALSSLMLTLSLDGGIVRSYSTGYASSASGSAMSASIGLSYFRSKWNGSMVYAKGLKSPDFMKTAAILYMQASIRF